MNIQRKNSTYHFTGKVNITDFSTHIVIVTSLLIDYESSSVSCVYCIVQNPLLGLALTSSFWIFMKYTAHYEYILLQVISLCLGPDTTFSSGCSEILSLHSLFSDCSRYIYCFARGYGFVIEICLFWNKFLFAF